jgi:hypothetical protein
MSTYVNADRLWDKIEIASERTIPSMVRGLSRDYAKSEAMHAGFKTAIAMVRGALDGEISDMNKVPTAPHLFKALDSMSKAEFAELSRRAFDETYDERKKVLDALEKGGR